MRFTTIRDLARMLGRPRNALLLASWMYTGALHYAHVAYLYPVWGYYGFTLKPIGPLAAIIIFLLVTLGALSMPAFIARASSVVLLLLYIVVFIPTVLFSLSLDVDGIERYGPSLLMLTLAFMCACWAARRRTSTPLLPAHLPDDKFGSAILVLWVVCCAILIGAYGSIMSFAGLDDIYEQREAGASVSAAMGYVQTYFANVLSPTLIAIGLVRSRRHMVFLGTSGCLIMYMINAQRTIFLLPLAILGFHFLLTRTNRFFRSTAFPLVLLSILVVVSTTFYEGNPVTLLLSLFIVFRTLSLPGLTFSQYHDLFTADGFTWWSHIKGFDLLVPAPAAFARDPLWPNLGYIVGDRVYGNAANNVNANLFSGDGLAAAGPIGVLVIGVVLAMWLLALDRATRGWDRRFAALATLPIGLAMTNGQFFTTMLSFGGLFWLLVFHFCKPSATPIRKTRRITQIGDSARTA